MEVGAGGRFDAWNVLHCSSNRAPMMRNARRLGPRPLSQELVVDVVKEELGKKAGMGKEETNDWVIRKTVGGPLR